MSQSQQTKLRQALENDEKLTLRINKDSVTKASGNTVNLTRTQIDKSNLLECGKATNMAFGKTQLRSIGHTRTRGRKAAEKANDTVVGAVAYK